MYQKSSNLTKYYTIYGFVILVGLVYDELGSILESEIKGFGQLSSLTFSTIK